MKVLVLGMTENYGGVESFIMNYYRRFNHSKVIFDFLTNTFQPIAYESELKKYGCHIYRIVKKSSNYFEYHKAVNHFFKVHAREYEVIWQNANILSNIDYLKLAKKYGIKIRIIHSHNTQNIYRGYIRIIRGLMHKRNKKRIDSYANIFWACSESASKFFYTDKIRKKARIIPNAINISDVTFSKDKRKKIRNSYNLAKNYVIGNIGRLSVQKNQTFTLNVFKRALKIEPKLKLILVGDGEKKDALITQINEMGLNKNVILTGTRKDIGALLSAFDLFFFPSLFEGLSVAILEAQANGVPILSSTGAISFEDEINKNVKTLDLKQDTEQLWAETLVKMARQSKRVSPKETRYNISKAGFNISIESEKLEKIFLSFSGKEN